MIGNNSADSDTIDTGLRSYRNKKWHKQLKLSKVMRTSHRVHLVLVSCIFFNSNKLFIGHPSSSAVTAIGGALYVEMLDHALYVLASSAVLVDANIKTTN